MKQMPIGMLMDCAKNEISSTVQSIMTNNNLPCDLMLYILQSIENDLAHAKGIGYAQEYLKLANSEEKGEENGNN